MEEPTTRRFADFNAFYGFYLQQHSDPRCRYCHYTGSTLVLLCLLAAIASSNYWLLLVLPVPGYGCAWMGHFLFEKNRPATFRYPVYSFIADWVMYRDWLLSPFRSGGH